MQEVAAEVLERVPVVVLICDQKGDIVYASRAIETILGYPPEDVLGDRWWRLTRPDPAERARAREFVRRAASRQIKPAPDSYEEVVLTKEGEERIFRWRDVQGPGQTLIGLGEDITETREAEAQLHRALRLKADFLANMSHEIRTPMNAVVGATNLLVDTDLAQRQKELVDVIRSSSVALLELVDNILDFSRIEAGRVEIEDRPFLLREFFADTVRLVASQAAQKNLDLAFEIGPEVPNRWLGDQARLRQVLINLLANAVKFTRRGWVLARLKRGATLADGRQELLFSVEDTGIGIAEEHQQQIFETFTQADGAISRRYGGTGLGLTICRRICELMGGSIHVESEVDRGTTFRFSILGKPDSESPREESNRRPDLLERLSGRKALIIEYGDASRQLMESWLEDLGLEVLAYSTPEGALPHVEAEVLSVAFLRFRTADRAAVRLLRELRLAAIPMISVATVGDVLSKRRLDRLTGQLLKPLRPEALEEALELLFVPSGGSDERQESEHETSAPPMPRLKILVAEDNPVNQMVILMMLERLGYPADMAADGYEVISAVEQKHYDVVLMDIQMPDMDGIEATRILREELHSPVQVIAFSANTEASLSKEWWLEAGMNDALMKPVLLEDLQKALARCRPIRSRKFPIQPPPTDDVCPFLSRCPMFPLFENEPIKKVYQANYCHGEFTDCQRYHLASSGTMPDPRLLPDGKMLPPSSE